MSEEEEKALRRLLRIPAPPPCPAAEGATAQGLVALGGKLTPALILDAYRRGIFPMAERDGTLGWWSPNPRGIIPVSKDYHVATRLERTSKKFEVRFDSDWKGVLEGCARPEGTWISAEIEREYGKLFQKKQAHTVEAWQGGKLAGGLYGVSIGSAFMAESKFHHVRDASKVALVALVRKLVERGFTLLDVQYVTPHLASMGAVWVSRREYLRRLGDAVIAGEKPFP
jgi:leucyl/phenylalanyl-tRNA--protein transferase